MKLFLIDAYALIYRSYYAFIKNPRINSKGMNTSAIFGFINSLEDVLKRENPTHIAVGFDPKGLDGKTKGNTIKFCWNGHLIPLKLLRGQNAGAAGFSQRPNFGQCPT